jgi:hypothetical protein
LSFFVRDAMPAPSLALDFAGLRALDSRITFTRTGEGAYYDTDRLVRVAPTNTPRFTCDPLTGRSLGLLVEVSRSNYVAYSSDYTPTAWLKLNCEIFQSVGPYWRADTKTAKLIETTANGEHGIHCDASQAADNAVITCYAVVAPAGRNQVIVGLLRKDNTEARVTFTLVGRGSYSSVSNCYTAKITPIANGFYICEITCNALTGAVIPKPLIRLLDSSGNRGYTGDGSSGIYLAHVQVENGSEASSPIFTSGAYATRNVDTVSITGSNFSSWFNSSEGTILVEGATNFRYATSNTFPFLFSINDGTNNNRLNIAYRVLSAYTDVSFDVYTGGTSQVGYATNVSETTSTWILSYKANDFSGAGRGVLLFTDAAGSLPTVNRIHIGMSASGNHLNGTVARLFYWPQRIADTFSPQLSIPIWSIGR